MLYNIITNKIHYIYTTTIKNKVENLRNDRYRNRNYSFIPSRLSGFLIFSDFSYSVSIMQLSYHPRSRYFRRLNTISDLFVLLKFTAFIGCWAMCMYNFLQ